MTTVEIAFRYAVPPTEQVAMALARARDVYGIRHLNFDQAAHILRVEFDATRLNAATVTHLVRDAGLEILPEPQPASPELAPPALPAPAPAAPAAA
jgi:hypothetical protein